MNDSMKQTVRGVVVAVVVLGSAAIIGGTFARQSKGPIRADVQESKRVLPGAKADPDEATTAAVGNGVVEPAEPETRVATDAAGRIATITVKEGDHVDRGDPLFELDAEVQRAELVAAEADLAAAEGGLARTTNGLRSQDILAAVSDAQAAHSRAALAVGEFGRAQELAKSGSISNAELDAQRRKMEAEQGARDAAEARASGARAGSRREDIVIADAHMRAARARRDIAKATLTKFRVVSPVSGEVLRVKARIGEYYNPQRGEPVVVVGDTSKLRVRMDVDERDVSRVIQGAPAFVTAAAHENTRFAGKVVEIGRRMGRRTVRADDPMDRVDVKILEVVIELEGKPPLVPGLRVLAHVRRP